MSAPLDVDGRLGRQFAGHDEQSRNFGVRALLAGGVQRKPTFWTMPVGPFPLDQGREGACTGFGLAHELAAGPVMFPDIDNAYAMARYRRNQEEDRRMGNSYPSGATVLATMKAAKADNLITGYRWCFGVDDVVDSLCSVGPVCLGVDWLSSMYRTSIDGRVTLSGQLVGGHFIDLLAYDEHPQWGPVVGWLNSWGRSYGVSESRLQVSAGIGWLTLPDLATLLARDGEAVVPADYFVAPKPTAAPYFAGTSYSRVFHDSHPRLRRVREFATYDDATRAGLRPCRVCRPQP